MVRFSIYPRTLFGVVWLLVPSGLSSMGKLVKSTLSPKPRCLHATLSRDDTILSLPVIGQDIGRISDAYMYVELLIARGTYNLTQRVSHCYGS